MPDQPRPTGHVRASSWLLLVLSMAGLVTLWVLLSLYTGGLHVWMALVVALDLAWVLRFGNWRQGFRRALLGLSATALVVLAAQWLIIAGQVGGQLGLMPLASATRLGFHHAWTLAQLANGPWELGCMAVALVVAVLASR
ncbi:hypothetical protein [Marilutibacter alkalisoli]|uniref:Transmembrane protein n=1 Tax=Marilutibacter alkalisoli TaxID=2591633 RepID=A0A514BTN6_9GAMM|nr:hypothetical protein [Lysobacter alkalisoli]QDH70736.1 hypothetical protein FKV23_12080 [Lysobacter alkalisoli]